MKWGIAFCFTHQAMPLVYDSYPVYSVSFISFMPAFHARPAFFPVV